MRPLILLVCLAGFCSLALAADQPTDRAKSLNSKDSDVVASAFPGLDSHLDSGFVLPINSDGDGQVYCLKMRTYKVKRVAPDSDVVRASGYTECMDSRRPRMENTDKSK